MSNEQRIRDEARAYIHKKRPEWHDNGVGIVQGSHYRSGFEAGAEWALTASPVIRRIQAEALREAAEEMDAGVSHLNPGNPTELSYINCTRIDAEELRQRADRIERGETA